MLDIKELFGWNKHTAEAVADVVVAGANAREADKKAELQEDASNDKPDLIRTLNSHGENITQETVNETVNDYGLTGAPRTPENVDSPDKNQSSPHLGNEFNLRQSGNDR